MAFRNRAVAKVFDEVIRPKLYRALQKYGTTNLPPSWRKDNKISEAIEQALDEAVEEAADNPKPADRVLE